MVEKVDNLEEKKISMKNCTNHFLKRWVERVVGITTEREVLSYIGKNKDTIVEHANKTFDLSELIYSGQIGDNITRNYYIKDDLVFVTNTTNDALVTIYKVDLGFTNELNTIVRKGLIDEIRKLTKEKEEIELHILEDIENKEHEVSMLKDKISIMTEQIDNLKKEKEFKKEEIKQLKKNSLNIGLDIKKHSLTLVNSRDYKEDILNIK